MKARTVYTSEKIKMLENVFDALTRAIVALEQAVENNSEATFVVHSVKVLRERRADIGGELFNLLRREKLAEIERLKWQYDILTDVEKQLATEIEHDKDLFDRAGSAHLAQALTGLMKLLDDANSQVMNYGERLKSLQTDRDKSVNLSDIEEDIEEWIEKPAGSASLINVPVFETVFKR